MSHISDLLPATFGGDLEKLYSPFFSVKHNIQTSFSDPPLLYQIRKLFKIRFSFLYSVLLKLRATRTFASALPAAINGDLGLEKRGCYQDNVLQALEAHGCGLSLLY